MRLFLIILLFLLSAFSIKGQNKDLNCERSLNQFVVDSWNKDNGLPSNSLLNVIQTSDGYVWISSYKGLIRFNGVEFTIFDKSNTPAIIANGIGAMDEDSAGVLWMTTQTGGILSYYNNTFQRHTFGGVVNELHRLLFIDSDANIWSCTSDGRLFFVHDTIVNFIENDLLPKNAIYSSVIQDKNGSIWIGTEGAGLFNLMKDKIKNFTVSDGLESNWINTITFDQNGALWVGTDRGVNVMSEKGMTSLHELNGFTVNKIIANKPSYVWLSTNSGVVRYKKKSRDIELLTKDFGLANNHTIDMFFDSENTLWVTHYKGGLSRIKNTMFATLVANNSMNGKIVNTICEIGKANYLVGYNNGNVVEIKGEKAYCYDLPKRLLGMRIRDIYKDSKNNLWVATYSGLLKVFPDKNFKWLTPQNGFPAKYIRVVYEDRLGNIWIGTRNRGLIKIVQPNVYKIIDVSKGLNNNLVMSVDEDAEGNILVGTSKGGVHIIQNDSVIKKYTFKDGLISDIVFNTYVDRDNIIWVAAKGGLSCIEHGNVFNVATNDSLLPYSPFDIVEDNHQMFWMPCSDGVMKISKSALLESVRNKIVKERVKLYGNQDGIEEPECTSTASALKGSDNKLWFPTINGICFTDPEYLIENKVVPPIYIEQIDIGEKQYIHTKPQQIPAGLDRITFYYTSLSYYYSIKNQFRYKLIGYSDKWSPLTHKRSVSYTNLAPGNYTFVVIGSNNDGLWNNTGEEYSFTVPYLWYQKVWFKIVAFLFGLFLVYLIYSARMKQLRKREQILKVLVKKRTLEITEKNRKIEERNTEILQVTEALKSQNEEIKTINEELEKLSIAASETDNAIRIIYEDGNIDWVNEYYTELYGLIETGANNESYNSEEFIAAMKECVKFKETRRIIEQKKKKDGQQIWVQTTLSPIKASPNNKSKIIALDSDITQLKNAENKIIKQNEELELYRESLENIVQERTAELITAKEKAEESEKLKIAFLTNMSHEIRTPMNAIVGFSDLLKMPDLSKDNMNEYIHTINENSETLLHLIDDIVEVSRIESGQIKIQNGWHSLTSFMKELHANYQIQFEDRLGLELLLKHSFHENDLTLFFDRSRFMQAIIPIMNNAIKYTESGFVELGCELQTPDLFMFYVKDSGIGIDKKDVKVIFERFRKIEENNLKLFRGAGLGLYIASRIVNALGGTIEVESELNKGSIFIIKIPVQSKDS